MLQLKQILTLSKKQLLVYLPSNPFSEKSSVPTTWLQCPYPYKVTLITSGGWSKGDFWPKLAQ